MYSIYRMLHLQVMSVVKGLVVRGISICASVHAPTPSTFNLFETLIFLLRGRLVYYGSNGTSACVPVPSMNQ